MALCKAVTEMGRIHIEGNVVPGSWFAHITYKTNRTLPKKTGVEIEEVERPNFLAAMILSDLVYWFRPMEVRDEHTGRHKGWRQKFSGDMLRRSYQGYADQFNVSKAQAKEAIDLLVKMDLLEREFRTVRDKEGNVYANTMWLAPIAKNVEEITYRPIKKEGKTPPSPDEEDRDEGPLYPLTDDGGGSEQTHQSTLPPPPTDAGVFGDYLKSGDYMERSSDKKISVPQGEEKAPDPPDLNLFDPHSGMTLSAWYLELLRRKYGPDWNPPEPEPPPLLKSYGSHNTTRIGNSLKKVFHKLTEGRMEGNGYGRENSQESPPPEQRGRGSVAVQPTDSAGHSGCCD